APVREPVREVLRARVEKEPRRADAVARDDDDLGLPAPLGAVGVVVHDAIRHAVVADRDLAHPAAGLELHAAADRGRPVRDVRARLRALRAADETRPGIDARRPALVLARRDRAVRRPPVPAELVEALRERRAELAE